ncbi:MAG: hypothetical protein HQL21_05680 [Candidatus Omnitrophica bacterium]|nr:hypothetical protein [Candidatus Omnitrophota bacterium]
MRMADQESPVVSDEIKVVHLAEIPTKMIKAGELENIARALAELTAQKPVEEISVPEKTEAIVIPQAEARSSRGILGDISFSLGKLTGSVVNSFNKEEGAS